MKLPSLGVLEVMVTTLLVLLSILIRSLLAALIPSFDHKMIFEQFLLPKHHFWRCNHRYRGRQDFECFADIIGGVAIRLDANVVARSADNPEAGTTCTG